SGVPCRKQLRQSGAAGCCGEKVSDRGAAMREEYELEVLEQYHIEVKGTRRIRGAFFCDTNEGTMLLKETRISGRRAPLLYEVLSRIEKRGNIKVDTPVFTKDGKLLVTSGEGTVY